MKKCGERRTVSKAYTGELKATIWERSSALYSIRENIYEIRRGKMDQTILLRNTRRNQKNYCILKERNSWYDDSETKYIQRKLQDFDDKSNSESYSM